MSEGGWRDLREIPDDLHILGTIAYFGDVNAEDESYDLSLHS